jgi:hypothetical protein
VQHVDSVRTPEHGVAKTSKVSCIDSRTCGLQSGVLSGKILAPVIATSVAASTGWLPTQDDPSRQ